MSLLLAFYAVASRALHSLVPKILRKRAKAGKEDPVRLNERLGHYPQPRPKGQLVWIHGVSVGESLSALPVVEMIKEKRPDMSFLITTATTTSAAIVAKRLPDFAQHAYAPIDTPQAVAGFLTHWKPNLALFIESDIWPTMLQQLVQHKIPHGLISARITAKTARHWGLVKGAINKLLRGYDFIMPQDEMSQQRIESMGIMCAERLNLKRFGDAPKVDHETFAALRAQVGPRFIIGAASTHYGENPIIAKACEAAIKDGALLIIVPRHPIRADEIVLDLRAMGFSVARRSLDEAIGAQTHIYVADTLGEMGAFLALSDLIIMGGSFLEGIGGHNPLEPARLGKGCLTGPDISNWEGIFEDLRAEGGALKVDGIESLGMTINALRTNPNAIESLNQCAKNAAQRQTHNLDDLWAHIRPILEGEHGA